VDFEYKPGLPDGVFSCQKIPIKGIFWRAMEWKCLNFMTIWNILLPFGNFVVIWYNFPPFGILCQRKSGNPATNQLFRAAESHFFPKCRICFSYRFEWQDFSLISSADPLLVGLERDDYVRGYHR
jgi:hypothetical protein